MLMDGRTTKTGTCFVPSGHPRYHKIALFASYFATDRRTPKRGRSTKAAAKDAFGSVEKGVPALRLLDLEAKSHC